MSLLVQARTLAVEYARLRLPEDGTASAERIEQRARALARRLRVMFVLHVKSDGQTLDSRDFSGSFVSLLRDMTDLRLTIPPVELTGGDRALTGLKAAPHIDYLIVARVDARLSTQAQSFFFFKSRANLSVQHVPSGRTLIQVGFPPAEETKAGDPQRRRAATRSASAGVRRLASLLVADLNDLVSIDPDS